MNSLANDIENNSTLSEKCNYFIFSKNLNNVLNEKSIELDKSDIYVFPEIRNIICLGKVGYVEKTDSSYIGTIYTNTKVINYFIMFTNFFVLTLIFFTKKLSEPTYYSLFVFFNGGIILNFYQSLNIISLNFMLIPLFIRILDKMELFNE
tara:strand:- start:1746 stop:2195 length:450 start_codon:yes stop_codon:yes gene_type:complete